jgi:putative ABC transport system substrate-binding protein
MQLDRMKRREFLALLGSTAVVWPLTARAQQQDLMRRIGVLMTLADTDSEGQLRVSAFRQELQKLGWIEGRNIQFEYRWAAGDAQRLRAYAQELVGIAPAVMLAGNNTALTALQEVNRTVPIVFAQVADPAGSGFVASLARPGGHVTGFALYEPAIAVKWLELLKEIAPSISRVAIIYDPSDFNSKHIQEIEAVIASFGVQLSSFIIRSVSDIERAIDGFAIQPHGGLIILPGPFTVVHRDLIINLAIRHALPNVYAYRYYPAAGGLASYGVDNVESYRRAASYVDRILKGEKPADLPVQLPTSFQLVINLKSAKALGLTIPPMLLARADEVIE